LLSAFIAAFAGGCQQTVVQTRANKLVGTVSDLYYEQVLDNLAMSIARPDILPYFGVPAQAVHVNARAFTAGYTPMWDLINTGSLLQGFMGRYFFDRQGASLQGQVANQEAFQLQPVSNPNRLLLMQAAFQRASGRPDPANPADQAMIDYLSRMDRPFGYAPAVVPGWYYKTTDWKEAWKAKKAGAYVGRYDGIYVCVPPENLRGLSSFTLAILDIATTAEKYFYPSKSGGAQAQPPSREGTFPSPEGTFPRPSEPFLFPFPAPPIIPMR
jgi:hypothetical protein